MPRVELRVRTDGGSQRHERAAIGVLAAIDDDRTVTNVLAATAAQLLLDPSTEVGFIEIARATAGRTVKARGRTRSRGWAAAGAALDRTRNRHRNRDAEFPLVTAPAADETDEDALESCDCRHDLAFRKNYVDVVAPMCFALLRYGSSATSSWSYPQACSAERGS